MGKEINPEIIHKGMLLRGRIEEIPASRLVSPPYVGLFVEVLRITAWRKSQSSGSEAGEKNLARNYLKYICDVDPGRLAQMKSQLPGARFRVVILPRVRRP
jgi:hypothetical protein